MDLPLHRNRNFCLWFTSDLFLSSSKEINSFANPLITYYVTHSVSDAGLVSAFTGLAALILAIPGGVISDSFDRRRCQLGACLVSLVIYSTFAVLLLTNQINLVLIITMATSVTCVTTLFASSGGILRQIVTPQQYPNALIITQARGAFVGLVSGPLGGFLLTVSLATPSAVVAIGSLVALLSTIGLRGKFTPDVPPRNMRDVNAGLATAVRWCFMNPLRIKMAFIECSANVGVNAVLFCVDLGLAKKGVPTTKIGLLTTAAAIAFLVGSLLASRLVQKVPTGVLNVIALSALAAGTMSIPFITNFYALGAVYSLMNISLPAAGAAMEGYYLSITPTELTGRVQSFMNLLSSGLAPFGIAAAGWGMARAGFTDTTLCFGILVLAGLTICLFSSGIRRIPIPAHWANYTTSA